MPTRLMPRRPRRISSAWWLDSPPHTGVPVPVYAMGPGSIRVAGFYDNTDIAKKFARIMDIEFVHISKDTTAESLEKELFFADVAWKLR